MMRSIKPATNPYKQMQNVTYFLEACSKYGVKTIFLPDDLVQGTGMESVIHCIHSLARQVYYLLIIDFLFLNYFFHFKKG